MRPGDKADSPDPHARLRPEAEPVRSREVVPALRRERPDGFVQYCLRISRVLQHMESDDGIERLVLERQCVRGAADEADVIPGCCESLIGNDQPAQRYVCAHQRVAASFPARHQETTGAAPYLEPPRSRPLPAPSPLP